MAANMPAAPPPATNTSVWRLIMSSISGSGHKRGQNARRRDRNLAQLDPADVERVIDCIGDRGGRPDRTALAHALLTKLGVRRWRFHVQDPNVGDLRRARQ